MPFSRLVIASFTLVTGLTARADTPQTPEPPKTDVPYLLMAQDLVATDAAQAQEEVKNKGKKSEIDTYTVPGEHATARTPLASPTFVLKVDSMSPESLQVYPFEIKNGHREISFSPKQKNKLFHLTAKQAEGALYRLEVDESLPPGEYSLSPNGSNQVFCFAVY